MVMLAKNEKWHKQHMKLKLSQNAQTKMEVEGVRRAQGL